MLGEVVVQVLAELESMVEPHAAGLALELKGLEQLSLGDRVRPKMTSEL